MRIPNENGGKMNDVAAFVVYTYTTLKANALAIGAKGSPLCNNNNFCITFFLTGAPLILTL